MLSKNYCTTLTKAVIGERAELMASTVCCTDGYTCDNSLTCNPPMA